MKGWNWNSAIFHNLLAILLQAILWLHLSKLYCYFNIISISKLKYIFISVGRILLLLLLQPSINLYLYLYTDFQAPRASHAFWYIM